jgi:predicted nuclease of predicted toxin-antitoxin system
VRILAAGDLASQPGAPATHPIKQARSTARDGTALPYRRETVSIDEKLSPKLVEPARARGYEAMHVNHLGLGTEKDWDLLRVVAEGDWVLVTNNAIEFRGRYRHIELQPGVVFLVPSVRGTEQVRLFEAALDHVTQQPTFIHWDAPEFTGADLPY